jgi:lipopolysaccharide export system permease protein
MKTNSELNQIIAEKKLKYKEALTTNTTADQQKDLKISYFRTEVELFSRYAVFPQIVLFIFLGFSLGIRRGRGAGGHSSSKAIFILLGYYLIYFFLISLANKSKLDPAFANFGPSLFLFFLSYKYYRDLDWIG